MLDTKSRDSSIGIATCYELWGWDSIPGRSNFSFLHGVKTDFGSIKPPIQRIKTNLSREAKRSELEADSSLPSIAKIKNYNAEPSLPHTSSWRGGQLITRRDYVIFTQLETRKITCRSPRTETFNFFFFILTTIEIFRHITVRLLNTKFRKSSFGSCQIVSCAQTDGRSEFNWLSAWSRKLLNIQFLPQSMRTASPLQRSLG
jgi:hypothetical protein